MNELEQQVLSLAEDVWTNVLGTPTTLQPSKPLAEGESRVTGSVQISGAFSGAVAVECSLDLARRAAASMFALEEAAVGRSEIRDALGEIANMIGGNVKALLPAPSRLSVPEVVDDQLEAAAEKEPPTHAVSLGYEDHEIVISIVVADEDTT